MRSTIKRNTKAGSDTLHKAQLSPFRLLDPPARKQAPGTATPANLGEGLPTCDWRREAWRELIEHFFPMPPTLWKEQYPIANSEIESRRRQRGMAELLLEIRPEYMFTVRFEHPLSATAIRSRLKRFGARLDRLLLGKNWYKCPNRSVWIALVENASHVHIALRPPEGRNITHYDYGDQLHLTVFWTSVVQRHRIAAKVHVIRIRDEDRLAIVRYCVKQAWRKDMWNDGHEFFILSAEFHSNRLQQTT
jgi:hypothetical protein